MAEIKIRICDVPGCENVILTEDVANNQVKFYVGDNPHFLGEVCNYHKSKVVTALPTNQKQG